MTVIAVCVVIGLLLGPIAGSLYAAWLDEHVPGWHMRPCWRGWWPR